MGLLNHLRTRIPRRAHREIALRQGGRPSRIAVGDEGKAVRIPKSAGCRDIALECRSNS